jgi:biotin carboxyl carrier protein
MRTNGFAALAVMVLAGASPLPALAATGGSPAPAPLAAPDSSAVVAASQASGGAAFGANVPRPAARPVARALKVSPRTLVAGTALPQMRFRIAQRGIEQVQARIVVLRLPRRAPVARKSLGWVKTGRSVTVRMPADLVLRQGRYLVRLHVKDSRGHTLRRDARNPGRASLIVRNPKPAPRPVAPTRPSTGLPAPTASPAGRGVFPVAGAYSLGGADGRFGAGRTGHIHEGQDIMAAGGVPVVAPYAGTVSRTSYQASGAGEYVVLDAVDGRDYFFAHCTRRSTIVAEGQAVVAGQQLCQVGRTGGASGTHLHFEIWLVGWRVDGGYPIDPLPELRAWAAG